MVTTKPSRPKRIAITVSSDVYALLFELADIYRGLGMTPATAAGLVADIVRVNLPLIQEMHRVGSELSQLSEVKKRRIAELASEVEPELIQSVEDANRQWQNLAAKISEIADV